MKFFAPSFLAFIVSVSGVCEDDLVALEAGQLPAVWNIGTHSHFFYNSIHLRGVVSTRDFKILGLDTVTTSIHLCPVDMTIYGNLSAGRIQFVGDYTSNSAFSIHGSQVFSQGDGFVNMTFTNLQLRNLVAPIRYSTKTKRLQIDDMQYELYEESVSPLITGMMVGGEGGHMMDGEEFVRIDQTSSFPVVVEVIKSVVNIKAQKGILSAAVMQMLGNVFSL